MAKDSICPTIVAVDLAVSILLGVTAETAKPRKTMTLKRILCPFGREDYKPSTAKRNTEKWRYAGFLFYLSMIINGLIDVDRSRKTRKKISKRRSRYLLNHDMLLEK